MDLWVRSQKGLVLKKINELMVEHKTGENIYFITDGRSCVLGEYETNERAVEVLDEIQERITILNLMSTINGEKEMIKMAHAFGEDKIDGVLKPYQMPKE